MSANNKQVGGTHYGSGIKHWDLAAARCYDYFQGQITKYVDRWKDKHTTPEKRREDLEKGLHFYEKYLEEFETFDRAAHPEDYRKLGYGIIPTHNAFVDNLMKRSEIGESPDSNYVNQDPDLKQPSVPLIFQDAQGNDIRKEGKCPECGSDAQLIRLQGFSDEPCANVWHETI